jgi:hypothetical protein
MPLVSCPNRVESVLIDIARVVCDFATKSASDSCEKANMKPTNLRIIPGNK